jgi:hypothetical protein
MTRQLTAALLAGALSLAGMGTASATIYSGTFSGIVTDGLDSSNYFGFGSGTDHTGLTVTGSFYYNTAAGGIIVGNELGAEGPTFPLIIYAQVEVGSSANALGTFSDEQGDVNFPTNRKFTLSGSDNDSGNLDSIAILIQSGGAAFVGSGLGQGFNLTGANIGDGSFFQSADFSSPSVGGDFTITSAELNDAPEPASGALLLVGMVGLGAYGRRRAKV